MPFAVVIVETSFGERHELALALDVPSRDLAAKIMRGLGRPFRPGDTFKLFIQTPTGDKPIPPFVTLAELGVTDGQHLRLMRDTGAMRLEPAPARAHLRTQSGELLPLVGNNIIIGRKDAVLQVPLDLDLALYDPGHAVSRRHACIERQGDSYYLLDLQSTNGTRLNGETVIPGRKMPLQDGAVIEFGLGLRLTFVASNPGAGEGS